MKRIRVDGRILMVAAASLFMAATALSGPMVPRPALSAEVRSLAGIRQLRLNVQRFPETFREFGMKEQAITKGWRNKLLQSGFEVHNFEDLSEDSADDLPELSFELATSADENVPGVVAFAAMVRLRQTVTVDRIADSMQLTTYLDHLLILETEQRAGQILEEAVAILVERFINQVRQADRAAAG